MASSSQGGKREKKKEAEFSAGVKADGDSDVLDAMGRKVWDKEMYMEKAKNNIMFGPERIGRRKDPVIPLPSSQRTFLQQRKHDMDLEKNLGKSQVVTAHTIKPMQGGYWCSVCECLLKDSSTYLEHVNGRRHNRNLGMNMKVEKIGLDRIKDKLKSLRKEPEAVNAIDIAERIAALEQEQVDKKQRKKDKKRKNKGGNQEEQDDEDGDMTGDEKDEKPLHLATAKKAKKGAFGEFAQEGEKSGGDDDDDDEDDEGQETEEQRMLKMMGLPSGFS